MSITDNADLAPVAEQYLGDGYEVIVHPDRDILPDFLAGFRPDILARKADENVVIGVVTRRELARKTHLFAYWVAKVNDQPGWRFDMVIDDPSPWPDRILQDAQEPDVEEIRERSLEARRVLEMGALMPAFLFAWSLAEAAMRIVAKAHAVRLASHRPGDVMRQLYMIGLLSSGELDQLRQSLEIRNTVAHGLATSGLDEASTAGVLALTEKLLMIADEARLKLAKA